jgi:hypothetical protein
MFDAGAAPDHLRPGGVAQDVRASLAFDRADLFQFSTHHFREPFISKGISPCIAPMLAQK